MLFNSFGFALFLPVIFALYWCAGGNRRILQNALLLAASYFFYSCWDWRFLFLLVFSTALDYGTGIFIYQSKTQIAKKLWLWISVGINLGFLGVFKYYDFFATSFSELLQHVGFEANLPLLRVVLPVGISFYTFHGLSYVIDIYKNRISPERNFVDYSLFVSYFPLLVAGPIERATHLLPQLKRKREFDYQKAIDGLHQIIWGLFKKVVIADTCAGFVNSIFTEYETLNSMSLLLGAVYFAFQIYGDFSGYSDMALGTSKLFGIDLLRNFNYPYFSRDIAEFWRRWHISLSSWFRDYLYIPLGGSKGGLPMKIRNTILIFVVSGFWHGANWTFIAWGLLNALYFIPLLISGNNRNHLDIVAKGKKLPSVKEFLQIILTFALTLVAWIFFRANTVSDAFLYIKRIFTGSFGVDYLWNERYSVEILPLLTLFVVVEWFSREKEHPISGRFTFLKFMLVLAAILVWGAFSSPADFIYFQF